jgi:O-antigen/teichoic acid export membrane protein
VDRQGIRAVGNVVVTAATAGLERLLTFVCVTLILRALSTNAGGGFVLMLRSASLVAVAVTLGLQAGAVRLISGSLAAGEEQRANLLLKAFLRIRVFMVLVLVSAGWLIAPSIATGLLNDPGSAIYLRFAAVAAGTNGLLSFTLHHLQARRRFVAYATVNTSTTVAKLIAIITLLVLGVRDGAWFAGTWALLPLLAALLGILIAPRGFLQRHSSGEVQHAQRELIRYGRWLTLGAIATAAFVNLDTLLVGRYEGIEAIAQYGAAINLALVVGILSGALATVLLPSVAEMERDESRTYFRRSLVISVLGSVLLLPTLLASGWLVSNVYGPGFANAVGPFEILFVAALIGLISNTVGLTFFGLDRPWAVACIGLSQFGAAFPLYLLLIPEVGIRGAALGTLGGQIAGLLTALILGIWHLRHPQKSQDVSPVR